MDEDGLDDSGDVLRLRCDHGDGLLLTNSADTRTRDDPVDIRLREDTVDRTRCGPCPNAELRLARADTLVVYEVITIVHQVKLQNQQLDRAMANMGIVKNLKKEEHVVVIRRAGARSVHLVLAEATRR